MEGGLIGIIRKPIDVDFIVDPRPFTKKEELAPSKFIKAYKAKRANAKIRLKTKAKQPA
jgi:hypothetical protein